MGASESKHERSTSHMAVPSDCDNDIRYLSSAYSVDSEESSSYTQPVGSCHPNAHLCWGGWIANVNHSHGIANSQKHSKNIMTSKKVTSTSSLRSNETEVTCAATPCHSPLTEKPVHNIDFNEDATSPAGVAEDPALQEAANRLIASVYPLQQQEEQDRLTRNLQEGGFQMYEPLYAHQQSQPPPPPVAPPQQPHLPFYCGGLEGVKESFSEVYSVMSSCDASSYYWPEQDSPDGLGTSLSFSSSYDQQESGTTPELITNAALPYRDQLLDQATYLECQGDLDGALAIYQECLVFDQDDLLGTAEVYHKIGLLSWKTGNYEDSLKVLVHCMDLYQDAFGIAEDKEDEDDEDGDTAVDTAPQKALALAEVLNSLGRVMISLGRTQDAMRNFKQSLALLKFAGKAQDGKVRGTWVALAQCKTGIGMVYDAKGNYGRAMKYYQAGLDVLREKLRIENVDVAASLNSIGHIHEKLGEYDMAMDCYEEALELYQSQVIDGCCSPVDVAVTLNNIGFIHHLWGEFDCAMKSYLDAVEILESVLGPNHRNVASARHNIGLVHAERGSYDKALSIYKQVLQNQRASLGDEHADIAVTLDSISTAYNHLGRLDEAADCLEKARRVRQCVFGKNHMYVGTTLTRLGQAYLKNEKLEQAGETFHEAIAVYEANRLTEDDFRICQVREFLSQLRQRASESSYLEDTAFLNAEGEKDSLDTEEFSYLRDQTEAEVVDDTEES
mmetsp:Transcript_7670/g.10936  ORF Transcript_7670/g.10936 Transcript_7670/m.10936 type:complete len:729 (-) Transcript_7670:113-2299(-)